jgi:Bacterial archaeo-eukaryotic release factor family 2
VVVNIDPLRELTRHGGPFASVYLDFSHDTEDAPAQLELRRRAIRDDLADQGADEATVAAVDSAIAGHEPAVGRAGLALIVADGVVLLDQTLRRPPPLPMVRFSELPYLLPLAEAAEPAVSHVVVVVDRVGADLRAVDRDGKAVTEEQVSGADHPIHKVRGGGWAHRSMQRRVEETAKSNVEDVAEEAGRLATQVGARVVVIAGEVQARTALLAALPGPAREVAVEAQAGGRADGTDDDALSDEIAEAVERVVKADRDAVLETYRAELGRGTGRAVQGLAATVAALREGNAEVLLANPRPLGDTTVWASSSQPEQLGHSAGELPDLGVTDAVQRRADEAIPLAAISVGADLQVDPELDLNEGVGVLRRY